MSRLTLRLPTSLHRQLESLAKAEGVSLNQYIVYVLTSKTSVATSIRYHDDTEIESQKARFDALLQRLGKASAAEIDAVLSRREKVAPDEGLTSEIRERLERKLAEARDRK